MEKNGKSPKVNHRSSRHRQSAKYNKMIENIVLLKRKYNRAFKQKEKFSPTDASEEKSDLQKLFELKKHEIKLNQDYQAMMSQLVNRIQNIVRREEEFGSEYKNIVLDLETHELRIIEKLQQK